MTAARKVVFLQLPIPPVGPRPIRGNVPLAAAYLTLYARSRGLDADHHFEIVSAWEANTLGDRALVRAILARDPWMVGLTCYLWSVERSLWIAARLKEARPDLKIVVGGPEITADNGWVLANPAIDYAVIGEGEQTFSDLLAALRSNVVAPANIPGLFVRGWSLAAPARRAPMPDLDPISSPYLAGILDAADEEMLYLETIRGCVFKCKFCYYPKSYDDLHFLSTEKIVANLEHARRRGAREVILLDPTLNQRRDFADFLRLLARSNPDRQFTFFGELRGEGIDAETARLLKEANFTEVEIGLQSVGPDAQQLMDRKNHLRAFERGAKALLNQGIRVKVDLIVGLPGDTAETVRRGIHYLRDVGLHSDVQVFNLAVLPGTAFRQDAAALGLEYQPRPPYYVLKTPTMGLEDMFQLMEEAQDVFEIDFDPLPPPTLDEPADIANGMARCRPYELDSPAALEPPPRETQTQAFTLWFRATDLDQQWTRARDVIRAVLRGNPFTTLQIVVEPIGKPAAVTARALAGLVEACQETPTYLDRFYAVLPGPGRPIGAKRLVVCLPFDARRDVPGEWIESIAPFATLAWREEGGNSARRPPLAASLSAETSPVELSEHEYLCP